MKNQKGITLIALVVTIVVLLILAGTSIAMLTGDNGIITNAQKASYANTEGEVIDKMQMAYNSIATEVKIKFATDVGYDATTETNLNAFVDLIASDLEIPDGDEADGEGYDVSADTEAKTITLKYTDAIFGGSTNKKYEAITCTINVKPDAVSLTGPTRQVNE